MPAARKDDNKPSPEPSILLVGKGRLGRALALRLRRRRWIGGRDVAGLGPLESPGPEGLILLAVADDALPLVSSRLAERLVVPRSRPLPVALHLSGSRDATALEPLRRLGLACGSCHPLQTFPERPRAGDPFRSITFAIEGDPPALAAARRLARRLGGRAVPIDASSKPLYHLAAVLAANGCVGLLGAARDALVAAGFPERRALAALRPLVLAAADAALSATPELALTGPVARGDDETLLRHRAALEAWDPERLELYATLVREQRRLVARRSRTGAASKKIGAGREPGV